MGDHECGFNITEQLQLRISVFVRYCRKIGSTIRYYMSFSQISSKPAIQTERNIIQHSYRVWNLMKLVRLIKMCLNEKYSKVGIGKRPSYSVPILNGLNQ
jgi:hypothetical protein